MIVVRFISNEGDVGIFTARTNAQPVEADWERTRGNLYGDSCLGLSRGDGSIDNRDSRRGIDELNLNIASRKVNAFTLDRYCDVTAGKRDACRIRCKRPAEDCVTGPHQDPKWISLATVVIHIPDTHKPLPRCKLAGDKRIPTTRLATATATAIIRFLNQITLSIVDLEFEISRNTEAPRKAINVLPAFVFDIKADPARLSGLKPAIQRNRKLHRDSRFTGQATGCDIHGWLFGPQKWPPIAFIAASSEHHV